MTAIPGWTISIFNEAGDRELVSELPLIGFGMASEELTNIPELERAHRWRTINAKAIVLPERVLQFHEFLSTQQEEFFQNRVRVRAEMEAVDYVGVMTSFNWDIEDNIVFDITWTVIGAQAVDWPVKTTKPIQKLTWQDYGF